MKVSFYIIYFLIFFYSSELFSAEIENVRYGSNAEFDRIVLDITNDITFRNEILTNLIKIKFDEKILVNKTLKKNIDLTELKFDDSSNTIILSFKKNIYSPNIYFLKKKKNKYARIVIDYKKKKKNKKNNCY